MMKAITKQRGFTMIEVLVSVVVLSVGMLGVAGLQATGQRTNHSAYLRSQATALAYDMIDRMRANKTAITSRAYKADNTATNNYSKPGSITAGCSAANMAAYDKNEWEALLAARLPSGYGTVAGGGAGSTFTVTVLWDDDRNGSGATTCGIGAMKCFSVSSAL